MHHDSATAKTVLGHLPIPSPGFKILDDWARESLHSSFDSLTLIGNNFFEVTFSHPDGVQDTLKNTFFFSGKEVSSTWNADFSSEREETFSFIEYPIWA